MIARSWSVAALFWEPLVPRRTPTALDANGDIFKDNDGAEANISITVEGGNISEDDTIHFESDGETGVGDKEKLAINGSVATGSFRLDHAVAGHGPLRAG